MNKYIILIFILVCIFVFLGRNFIEKFTLRKRKIDLINEMNSNTRCVDKFDRCFNGNLYTPPDGSGQIISYDQTDCDNPLNQDAEARMWLNCCKTCNERVKNTPRLSVCKDFLGRDEENNDYCEKKIRETGCGNILDVVCCNTCSKVNTPKFIIDKNLQINDSLVLHQNNFNERTDINGQVKNVLDYITDSNENTIRRDEDADIFVKENNYIGNNLGYVENKKPSLFFDQVKLDGDILEEILKFKGPYFTPFNPNPRVELDQDTIHKYGLYDSDKKYEKLCFDDRTKPDGQDICIDSSHLKMLNGERDIKIKDINNRCLGYSTNGRFDKTSSNFHNHWYNPSTKDTSNTLFFDTCGNEVSTNRFKFEKIKEIDSNLEIKK
jgi:hypothetical protein